MTNLHPERSFVVGSSSLYAGLIHRAPEFLSKTRTSAFQAVVEEEGLALDEAEAREDTVHRSRRSWNSSKPDADSHTQRHAERPSSMTTM